MKEGGIAINGKSKREFHSVTIKSGLNIQACLLNTIFGLVFVQKKKKVKVGLLIASQHAGLV